MTSSAPLLANGPPSELANAFNGYRRYFLVVAVISGLINILMLTGAVFMLEIYDRVLPSRSVPTLIGLLSIAVLLYLFLGIFDFLRGRLLVRTAAVFEVGVAASVFRAVVRMPLKARLQGDGMHPLRDLDQIRSFLAGGGPAALFDLPWIPIYLTFCFLLHFWIGATALGGALILIVLAVLGELWTRAPALLASSFASTRFSVAQASQRNAEVLEAMGMGGRFEQRYNLACSGLISAQRKALDVGGGLGALSRATRLLLQSAVLAVGAYLVIFQEASAGIIVAGSIIAARSLAPVEQIIANWRGFVAARQGWGRIESLLAQHPARQRPLLLPPPTASLSVENLSVFPPGQIEPAIQGINFRIRAGQGLAVIGPSAAGKSTLARALSGVWPASQGEIRLDDAALDQWLPETLGPHVGYVPQDIELFDGTVVENIARFDPSPDSEAVIAAARAAGVHDMILRLPDGYATAVGIGGQALSAGQRQRIALARALYRDPFLVILDEPNSNLDSEGEDALNKAITNIRRRGGIVVVIAHRPSALAAVDLVLTLSMGRQQAFGPRDEVLRRVLRPASVPQENAAEGKAS